MIIQIDGVMQSYQKNSMFDKSEVLQQQKQTSLHIEHLIEQQQTLCHIEILWNLTMPFISELRTKHTICRFLSIVNFPQ